MSKHLGPIALSAALLGLVAGGVYAGTQAFAPVEPSKPAVELVQPAAQTVTPSPTTTTAAVAPKAPVKVAPKVESSPKVVATSAAPVQEAVVPKSEPAPETTTSAPAEATPPAGSAFDSFSKKKQSPPTPPAPAE